MERQTLHRGERWMDVKRWWWWWWWFL